MPVRRGYKLLQIKLPNNMFKRIEDIMEHSYMSKSDIIENIIRQFFYDNLTMEQVISTLQDQHK